MEASPVAEHYGQHDVISRIRAQLVSAGYDLANLDPDALAGVDEFHLGGRLATNVILESLDLTAETRVLDVGCGIGGAARTMAATTGCSVNGVDLTPQFVSAAEHLTELVGLADLATFEIGDALALPFDDGGFDAVTMFHVGMNIADKAGLIEELARMLQPGGTLVVYDIMRLGDGDITYPVPWASDASTSFVAAPAIYVDAMKGAGLLPQEPIDRMDIVRKALDAATQNPPPVNLSHLMGADWPTMFGNVGIALNAGFLSPTQIVAHRPA